MTELKVEGMSCGHCQAAVKGALEEVPGVKGVEVDLAKGIARIDGVVETQALLSAVQEAGYQATPAAT